MPALACIKSLTDRGNGLWNHSQFVAFLVGQVLLVRPSLAQGTNESYIILAALLHDLGKTQWPNHYFTAAAHSLSNTDFFIMQTHPIQGAARAKELGLAPEIVTLVAQHHERPGGQGYPKNLQSPLPQALVIGACDVFAACTEFRPYRDKPLPFDKALAAAENVCPETAAALNEVCTPNTLKRFQHP